MALYFNFLRNIRFNQYPLISLMYFLPLNFNEYITVVVV